MTDEASLDDPFAPKGRIIRKVGPGGQDFYQERYDRGDGRDAAGRIMPGHTMNPHGRPSPRHSLVRAIREQIDPQEFARNIIRDANQGDNQARKLIMNYVEGLPKQTIDHQGIKQAPIIILPSNGREQPVPQTVIIHDQRVEEALLEEGDYEDEGDDTGEDEWIP